MPCGADEGGKQHAVQPSVRQVPKALRMPLHSNAEAACRALGGLNDLIGAPCSGDKRVRDGLHGLMVMRIGEELCRTEDMVELTAFLHGNKMRHFLGWLRLLMNKRRAGLLRRQILIQCAAQRHIQHLNTAANAQQWHVLRNGGTAKRQLPRITNRRNQPARRQRFFAVISGSNVIATRQQ